MTTTTVIKNFLSTLGWYALRHPLGNLITASTILFLIASNSGLESAPSRFDPLILLYAALMALAVATTIIVQTKREMWTTLSAGLLGVFFGVTLLFGELVFREIYGSYEHRQTILAIARSVFVTSTTWVLVGLFFEWWYEARMSRERLFWVLRHPLLAFRQRNTDNSKG